ncbi:hypothetical protein DSO57_1030126 [Entomophthora muscae]|uniref:Uncharacterized protein n=1 Tax=Entomophthora muscae TaxID=34485 RepID=A0ACC2ULF0_9FUNG|nr:hypothetical protein DSO57_1030126 [Entomophthora muscae]
MQSLGFGPGWLCLLAFAASANPQESTTPPLPSDSNNFKDLQINCVNSNLYCSPQPEENWHINKPHVVRWNPLYPSLVGGGTLSIALFVSDNSREPVLIRTNVPNMDGNYPITITKDELYKFDPIPNFSTNGTYLPKKAWFTVLPTSNSGFPMDARSVINLIDPEAYSFKANVTETPPVSRTSSPTETETGSPSNVEFTDRPKGIGMGSREEFPVYGIILLALTLLAILGLLVFLLLFWRRRRRQRKGNRQEEIEKDILDGGNPNLGSAQRLHSMSSTGYVPSGSRTSAITSDTTSPLHKKTNLSANDAIMLSETFRELLRKPSWSEEPVSGQIDGDLMEPDKSTSIRLEEELALDGVGLHELESKRNLTIIHDGPESPSNQAK